MPKFMSRVYSQYDAEYQATPIQKKRRAQRNAARRAMMKKGLVRKNDGLEIHHISANKGGNLSNAPSNLRVEDASTNRARK